MASERIARTIRFAIWGAIIGFVLNWARNHFIALMYASGGLLLFMLLGVGVSKAVNFLVMPITGHPIMGVRHTAWGDRHIRFDNGRVGLGGQYGEDIVIQGTVYNDSPWTMSDIGVECHALVSYTDLGEVDQFFGYYKGEHAMYEPNGKLVEGLTKGEIAAYTEAKITLRVKSSGGYLDPTIDTLSCKFQNYKLD